MAKDGWGNIPKDIFDGLGHHKIVLPKKFLPENVIPIRKEHGWWAHPPPCINFEFYLRSDGKIVCKMCDAVVGTYYLDEPD